MGDPGPRLRGVAARVFAGQQAAGQRAPADQPEALVGARRQYLALDVAADQVVQVLTAAEPLEPLTLRHGVGFDQLPGVEVAAPDVADPPLAHEVVQGPHRLLNRGVRVGPVDLVQVDVVGPEPLEAGVARLDDVFA